jgi:hypothetical protein
MSAGIVTNAGLAAVVAAWSASVAAPLYLQAGTGSGQDATATDLAAAVQARELGTASLETVTVSGDTYRLEATITAEGDVSVTEAGVFDAAGNLHIYGDFTAINLVAGDIIIFQVNVTASQV